MKKYSTVYYPHTSMRSGKLLASSLLMWDYVDCIVPYRDFSLTDGMDRQHAEAAELLLKARVPRRSEQNCVDQTITELFRPGVPPWIYRLFATGPTGTQRNNRQVRLADDFLIFPQKFMTQTWGRLRRHEVARFLHHIGDWAVPPPLGLLLMAELAHAMAGQAQHTITDRIPAYGCLFGTITDSLGGDLIPARIESSPVDTMDRFATIAVRSTNPNKINFKRMLDLRKKEEKESSHDLRKLRHAYLDESRKYIDEVRKPGLSLNDQKEILRQFAESIESDFADLKRELGMARKEVLFSKEVGVATVVLAGGLAEAVSPGPLLTSTLQSVGIGALVRVSTKYTRARRKALTNHASSWLYLSSQARPFRRF